MVDGHSGLIVGLNLVGLRRNGYHASDITQLKAAYRLIYRSGLRWVEILEQLKQQFTSGPAADFHAVLLARHPRLRARTPDAAQRHPQAPPRLRRRPRRTSHQQSRLIAAAVLDENLGQRLSPPYFFVAAASSATAAWAAASRAIGTRNGEQLT